MIIISEIQVPRFYCHSLFVGTESSAATDGIYEGTGTVHLCPLLRAHGSGTYSPFAARTQEGSY